MSGLGLNNVNSPYIPALEGPVTFQPIFLKNLLTAIRSDAIYVVVALSLTHKSNFPMSYQAGFRLNAFLRDTTIFP